MYHIKDDQRSIRSSEMIFDGLTRLMKEHDFHSITVTDLVKEAQIGRTTFYRNFDEIEDILRWQCDQTIDKLVIYIIEYFQERQSAGILLLIKPVLRFFYLHSMIIELLIEAKRIDILQTGFQSRVEQFSTMALPDAPGEYLDYWAVVRANMAVSVLVHWIKTGKKQAPDELADGLSDLVRQMSQSQLPL